MKRNKILTITLILAIILSLGFPARASEGDLPAEPDQSETVQLPGENLPEQVPDGTAEPDPAPAPGEEIPARPADPAEGEVIPPVADGGEETPSEGEESGNLPPSEEGETPVEGEENPEEEAPSTENPGGEAPEERDPALDEGDGTDSLVEPRVIDVVVPPSGQVVINPYNMKVATTYGESTEQIIHEPQVMISSSDFPVLVAARVVGFLSPESAARFVTAPPADGTVDKEIFMYMEFQNDPVLWSGSFGDWPNQILVTDWGAEKENVMTLDAFGNGYFRLFGAMTDSPNFMWDEVDAPDVTVAFTFSALEPQPEAEPAVSPLEALPEEVPPEETFPTSDNLPEDVPTEDDFPAIEEIPAEGNLPAEEILPSEENVSAPEDIGVNYG